MKYITYIFLLLLSCSAIADSEDLIADKVLVDKSERKMWLIKNNKKYKEYKIALGGSPKGHKGQQGDEKTPEGNYILNYRNPKSSYHLSLHITYPNAQDKAKAKKNGIDPGGDIFIHGAPNGYSLLSAALQNIDWTDGCIAVTSKEIEEIWKLVKNGTPIEILP